MLASLRAIAKGNHTSQFSTLNALGKLRGCSEFSRRHRCARGESDGRSFAPVKPPEAYLSRLRGMWAQSELTSANRPQTREKGQEKQESSQPDQRDKSTESVQ